MPKGRHGKGHGGKEGADAKKKERAVRQALRKERKAGASLDPSDPDFRSFTNQLQTQGLRLHDVPGDGNCLFRAFTDQLSDGHSNHRTLRRAVVQYMRDNEEDFAPFVEDGESFEHHVSQLAKDGVYAGNDAIVAFARCYGVSVVIHQLNAPQWEVHTPASGASGGRTLHVAYLNGEHYCSVRPLLPSQPLPPLAASSASRPQGSDSRSGGHQASAQRNKGEDERANAIQATLQRVIESTGCQDVDLAEQCLRENAYDPDLAIVELLQLMDLSGIPELPCSVEPVAQERKSPEHPKSKPAHPRGGLPISPTTSTRGKNPPQAQRHLSNRERKELAKAERKERRIEEQKSQAKVKTPQQTDNPVGAMAI